MATTPIQAEMQQRRGTAAQWTAGNPVLLAGEIGVETDTRNIKVGDGVTAWTALSYYTSPGFATGLFMPSDWGRSTNGWFASRAAAKAGTKLTKIVHWTDSLGGFFSSNWNTKGITGKLGVDLQALYGDGGSGFVSVQECAGIVAGSASSITATGTSGTGAGGWDAYLFGPNSYLLFAHAAANGATLIDTNVRGRFIDVYYLPTTAAGVSFNYAVSGGGPSGTQSCTVGSVTGIGVLTIDRGAGVTATCTLTVTVNAGQPFLAGWRGRNASGIHQIRYVHAGRTTADVSTAAAVGLPAGQTTGWFVANLDAPDLLFDQVGGINDIAASVSAINFVFNKSVLYDQVKAANPNCDIFIQMAHRGSTVDTSELYPSYVREVRALAEAYGAVVVNPWPVGKNSWTYWNGFGYWGDGTNDGLAGSNSVHWSDAGHAFNEGAVLSVLSAP